MTLYIRPEAAEVVDPATLEALQAIIARGYIVPDRRQHAPVVLTVPVVAAGTPAATPGYVRYVATRKRLTEPLGPTVVAVYRLLRDNPHGLSLQQIVALGPSRATNTLRWAIQLLRVKGYVRSEG
jgi:hypothetical protein